MMTMRKAVEGRSPQEIVQLKEEGKLDGEISPADFVDALKRTPPSVSPDELKAFAEWDAEFGSHS